ncbi:MAG: DUF898 family protein [Rhodobacteraceae bacterium]|nr:DUF898 family protein [Paracoccaceae bacterium]
MFDQSLQTDYAGTRGPLFWLALKTSTLTVLTLGIYRFWMKTRIRRYFWSAIRPGGIALEYSGTGVEKLMGFLVAVVVLAFYIGVFNLILMFLSFSLLNNNVVAYLASFVGLIPIYFYARYRARRYILARTRWRGIRFGAESAAWSYAWRAMLLWLATILSLGIYLPRQIFRLEKFRTDRTWYGQQKFCQTGNWKMLLRGARHYYIGLGLTITAGLGGFVNQSMLGLLVLSLPWLAIGFVHLRVTAFRRMTDAKRLGNDIGFCAHPRTGRVLGIYLLGYFLVGLCLVMSMVLLILIAVVVMVMLQSGALGYDSFGALFSGKGKSAEYLVYVGIALVYFGFFILLGVLRQVFVTLPMLRHYAETLEIRGGHHLATIRQRPRDEFSEAEGFAEALDIGAAI